MGRTGRNDGARRRGRRRGYGKRGSDRRRARNPRERGAYHSVCTTSIPAFVSASARAFIQPFAKAFSSSGAPFL